MNKNSWYGVSVGTIKARFRRKMLIINAKWWTGNVKIFKILVKNCLTGWWLKTRENACFARHRWHSVIIRLRKAFNDVYEIKVTRVVNFIFGQTAENLKQKYAGLFWPKILLWTRKSGTYIGKIQKFKRAGFLGERKSLCKNVRELVPPPNVITHTPWWLILI